MTVLSRKGTPSGGEARRLSSAVTEEILEYKSKGRVFRVAFDPRESGRHCFISLYAWEEPEGLLVAPEDHDEILDGLWSIAPEAGARAIIVFERELNCYVARRWSYPEGHLLVTINTTHIEVLELGKTLRVAYKEKAGAPATDPVAIAEAATAEWLYPERKPLTEYDWSAVAPKLRAVTPKNLFMSAYEWKIES
jgi:hypothetical protein